MRRRTSLSIALLSTLLGCSQADTAALATVEPLGDASVRGTVEFTKVAPDRIRIRAQFQGLTPGLHGLHIHEFGDCTAPDGSSAGPHFNPEHMQHGGPEGPKHHLGDLGNIKADVDGRAAISMTTGAITLDNGPHGVLGRSLVVHAQADDLVTDPAGNSGARIACGMIRSPAGPTTPVLPQP